MIEQNIRQCTDTEFHCGNGNCHLLNATLVSATTVIR